MIKGKVAIITGASSGIGYATGLALSKAGAKIAAGARRTDRLESLKREIVGNGGEAFTQKLDVTKKADCDAFVDAVIRKWGSVDILVNNAGLMPLSFFKSLKVDEWNQMIDVNIKGVLYCTAAVITHMLNNKSGHIVNISSVAGRTVSQRANIRVTCIEPGVVATELTNTITDKALEKFVESTKQMQALQAEDIANAILFAVESPSRMNVNQILIRPTTQER
jgi:NADP-dependent 3-hydroxy acid dehydrogenase YdfG